MWYFARLDVLTARLLKIQAFLLVTVCRWASISRRFETPYCLRLQCQAVQGEQLRCRCQRRVSYVDESVSPFVLLSSPLWGPWPHMDVVMILRVVLSVSVTCQWLRSFSSLHSCIVPTSLLHGAEPFLRSLPVFRESRNSPHFMEPNVEMPATCPYTEPAPSSRYPHIPLPEDPS